MICFSSFLTSLCSPAIISYKPFIVDFVLYSPDELSEDPTPLRKPYGAILLNNGFFTLFQGMGCLVTYFWLRRWSSINNCSCFGICAIQTICVISIYLASLKGSDFFQNCFETHADCAWANAFLSIVWIMIWVLGFLHGLTVSYFLTKMPPIKLVPYSSQATAYFLRGFMRSAASLIGFAIQWLFIWWK